MDQVTYGRIRDLNGLPELLVRKAGHEGLRTALDRHSLSMSVLDCPDAIIPMKDIIGLYRTASEVTSIRSFGLKARESTAITEFGLNGDFMMQARTLKDALKRFQAALPYHESGSSLIIQETRDELIIGYKNIFQDMIGYRHGGDMTLRVIEAVINAFLGKNWNPRRITLCGKKGPWEQDYEEAFQAPVLFHDDKITIVLDKSAAERPRECEEMSPGNLVTLADIKRSGEALPHDFVGSVARIIELQLPEQRANLEETASKLAIGPRTLQRRLGTHGFTYRQLTDRCRMQRACELLSGSNATVETIGREVGYSATSHFTRAFSRVFDITPSEFRMRH